MLPNKDDIDKLFRSFTSRWGLEETGCDGKVEYRLSKGDRFVIFAWDCGVPEEIWFVFGESNKYIFEDWTEMFESEDKGKFLDYLEMLATRFLEHGYRLRRRWIVFGSPILQYCNEGSWFDIRTPT